MNIKDIDMQLSVAYGKQQDEMDIIKDIQKAYRINYQSKDGKIDFIGANKEELESKIAELKQFGHKVLNIVDFK